MRMGDLPTVAPDAVWHALWTAASAPYRRSGRFAWHFARGKLTRDPVFRALLERGDLARAARIVDIGCGQALIASLLACAAEARRAGRWPAEWPATPQALQYTGVELMPRDAARAEGALRSIAWPGSTLAVQCADMRQAALPACDAVVILDVLHYVDHDAQAAVLRRVHGALRAGGPGGKLLLRIGDAAQQRGFRISQWVDRTVTRIRGHRVAPTWGRTLEAWIALLQQTGFAARPVPMSQGTPFANVLLVATAEGTR